MLWLTLTAILLHLSDQLDNVVVNTASSCLERKLLDSSVSCQPNGDYAAKQCTDKLGVCYCATETGLVIPGTKFNDNKNYLCQNVRYELKFTFEDTAPGMGLIGTVKGPINQIAEKLTKSDRKNAIWSVDNVMMRDDKGEKSVLSGRISGYNTMQSESQVARKVKTLFGSASNYKNFNLVKTYDSVHAGQCPGVGGKCDKSAKVCRSDSECKRHELCCPTECTATCVSVKSAKSGTVSLASSSTTPAVTTLPLSDKLTTQDWYHTSSDTTPEAGGTVMLTTSSADKTIFSLATTPTSDGQTPDQTATDLPATTSTQPKTSAILKTQHFKNTTEVTEPITSYDLSTTKITTEHLKTDAERTELAETTPSQTTASQTTTMTTGVVEPDPLDELVTRHLPTTTATEPPTSSQFSTSRYDGRPGTTVFVPITDGTMIYSDETTEMLTTTPEGEATTKPSTTKPLSDSETQTQTTQTQTTQSETQTTQSETQTTQSETQTTESMKKTEPADTQPERTSTYEINTVSDELTTKLTHQTVSDVMKSTEVDTSPGLVTLSKPTSESPPTTEMDPTTTYPVMEVSSTEEELQTTRLPAVQSTATSTSTTISTTTSLFSLGVKGLTTAMPTSETGRETTEIETQTPTIVQSETHSIPQNETQIPTTESVQTETETTESVQTETETTESVQTETETTESVQTETETTESVQTETETETTESVQTGTPTTESIASKETESPPVDETEPITVLTEEYTKTEIVTDLPSTEVDPETEALTVRITTARPASTSVTRPPTTTIQTGHQLSSDAETEIGATDALTTPSETETSSQMITESVGKLTSKCEEDARQALLQNVEAPVCEVDGTYSRQQCNSKKGICWCVDAGSGEEITGSTRFGSAECDNVLEQTTSPTFTTTVPMGDCWKSYTKALQVQKADPDAFIPACDSNGLYLQSQCHGSFCWCVDQSTGDKINGTMKPGPISCDMYINGVCPEFARDHNTDGGGCFDKCESDTNCYGTTKCCQTKCGRDCIYPQYKADLKGGLCPAPQSLNSIFDGCSVDCNSDQECSGTSKCCFTGCGYSCKTPVFDTNVYCKKISMLYKGRVEEPQPQYSEGDVITLSCNHGYQLQGNAHIRCLSSGLWEHQLPVCKRVTCGVPGSGQFVLARGNDHWVGGVVTYHCYNGYELVGNSTATCLMSGRWSSEPPTCTRRQCAQINELKYGKVFGGIRTYGNRIGFRCDYGYTLIGSEQRMCLSDGSWSGTDARCVRGYYPRTKRHKFSQNSGLGPDLDYMINTEKCQYEAVDTIDFNGDCIEDVWTIQCNCGDPNTVEVTVKVLCQKGDKEFIERTINIGTDCSCCT